MVGSVHPYYGFHTLHWGLPPSGEQVYESASVSNCMVHGFVFRDSGLH